MARAIAYRGVDIPNTSVWFGFVQVANSGRIVISDGFRKTIYEGSFRYDAAGRVSGTMNKITEFAGGQKLYTVSGIGASAAALYNAIQIQANFQKAAAIVLAKNDSLTGSLFADKIKSFAGNDIVNARDGNDTVWAGSGHDVVRGGLGNDTVFGNQGNDRLIGQGGVDRLVGQSGNDILSGGSGDDVLIGGGGSDRVYGGAGNDILNGGSAADILRGGGDNDTLIGGSGNDNLAGGSGDDILQGGAGRDILAGGAGADQFIFKAVSESRVGGTKRDVVTDFVQGEDVIDVSAIDATSQPLDQAFTFIGESAFSGTEGELRFVKNTTSGVTIVSADIDGDGSADFQVQLTGIFDLNQTDFIL